MWDVLNYTPYEVGHSWGRDIDGVYQWLVAVKATFTIGENGRLTLADEQRPTLLAPEYNGDDGVSSLRYEADVVAPKPATDVIVNGTAYAPSGRPRTEYAVELRVEQIRKSLRVRGNRHWRRRFWGAITPSFAEPVTQVPIVYERAYGGYDHDDPNPKKHGWDARNPVGCGVAYHRRRRIGQLLPNFEYPHGNVRSAGPAGFGALDAYWSPRRERQGTYGEVWQKTRRPLLPSDWDPRSLLYSPEDQRPQNPLRGGEVIELTNLTPNGRMQFVLPKIHLTYRTQLDGRAEEHRGQMSSVIIEPDERRLTLVWTTSLRCPSNVDYLEETVVREKPFAND